MSDRTFTLDEALSLLPVLESLLRTAIAGKKVMEWVPRGRHRALALTNLEYGMEMALRGIPRAQMAEGAD